MKFRKWGNTTCNLNKKQMQIAHDRLYTCEKNNFIHVQGEPKN